MAESKGGKRYGHGPKIADKGSKNQGTEHETTKPKEDGGSHPKGTEVAGTESVKTDRTTPNQPSAATSGDEERSATPHEESTHERHLAERKEMMKRHGDEMSAMHERHSKEHGDMAKRHEKELGPSEAA